MTVYRTLKVCFGRDALIRMHAHSPCAPDLENETPGSPCEIVEINDQGELILNEKNFEQIVKAVGNAEIAVISIAGAFRRGKSFLLNVFLRYLCYSVRSSAVRG